MLSIDHFKTPRTAPRWNGVKRLEDELMVLIIQQNVGNLFARRAYGGNPRYIQDVLKDVRAEYLAAKRRH